MRVIFQSLLCLFLVHCLRGWHSVTATETTIACVIYDVLYTTGLSTTGLSKILTPYLPTLPFDCFQDPDDDLHSSSMPPPTAQGCPQSRVPRAPTTDPHEDPPNIEEERASSIDVASRSEGADVSDKGPANGRQTSSLPQLPDVGENCRNTSPISSGKGETVFEKRLENPETAHPDASEKEITANTAYTTDELHNGGLLPQDETPPQVIDTPGASRGSFWMLRTFPTFLGEGDNKDNFWKGNDSRVLDNEDRETLSPWDSSTCQSFLGEPWSNRVVNSKVFLVDHDHARARKNWRVMRAVIIALGKWR